MDSKVAELPKLTRTQKTAMARVPRTGWVYGKRVGNAATLRALKNKGYLECKGEHPHEIFLMWRRTEACGIKQYGLLECFGS